MKKYIVASETIGNKGSVFIFLSICHGWIILWNTLKKKLLEKLKWYTKYKALFFVIRVN